MRILSYLIIAAANTESLSSNASCRFVNQKFRYSLNPGTQSCPSLERLRLLKGKPTSEYNSPLSLAGSPFDLQTKHGNDARYGMVLRVVFAILADKEDGHERLSRCRIGSVM